VCFSRDWVEKFRRPWKFYLVVNRHNQIRSEELRLSRCDREQAQCHFV
jgi:hypothetical protein